ncbi:VOC family protein [Altererythrobacter arenosus]|uniref:VOC family protein n=1 Tax=Altererythrobacter arenosus TaxID=3032592 RepID=A0ABY8FNE6_9SPHN|nr:VOC family protein [Altererythrobacter sp. CAU 1644]WFL76382.1 VOC family protein [Altererythrobacter sp. CAU 1644]
MSIAHGTILGGLSTVPDLEQALRAYRDVLGLELVEQSKIDAGLAACWGCPANVGSPYAVLRPVSGEPCWFRLVEQPDHPDFRPTRSFGWAAFECTVEDVWRWPDALPEDLFTIVGPPKNIENMKPTFIPMQALGPGREMIYLNQVLVPESDLLLPPARSPVDRIFICVLAATDREKAIAWYREALGLERGADYTIPYTMINKAFELAPDTLTTLTMIQHARMPIVEIDDYPAAATERPRHADMLPPGNALVTLAMRDLDTCQVEWISPPSDRSGALYEGRRVATTVGPSGELVECVEVG